MFGIFAYADTNAHLCHKSKYANYKHKFAGVFVTYGREFAQNCQKPLYLSYGLINPETWQHKEVHMMSTTKAIPCFRLVVGV